MTVNYFNIMSFAGFSSYLSGVSKCDSWIIRLFICCQLTAYGELPSPIHTYVHPRFLPLDANGSTCCISYTSHSPPFMFSKANHYRDTHPSCQHHTGWPRMRGDGVKPSSCIGMRWSQPLTISIIFLQCLDRSSRP